MRAGAFDRDGEQDGRKKLRAHWPPRLKQTVQVELPDWLYADLYTSAKAEGWSLQDEIRSRLREEMHRER
ncbi:hypothetical protein [Mesorhizobium sp.]|uniref:hypothetical protein n=1 Tax=Mesorhizobium sp. TaxID=1871066 RepID=UPI0025CD5688|nr:hypothetical protein [Mesorhizobium sp.]